MEKFQLGMTTHGRKRAQTGHKTNSQTASESDKDSGFSDVASECLSSVEHTDTEESSLSSRRRRDANLLGGPPPRPPPQLILNNLLVNQGSSPDPSLHSWTVLPSFQLLPTSSPVLVFPSSISPEKLQPSIGKSTKYLPILNSYPKIAPHPLQLPPQRHKRGAGTRHQNQTKLHFPRPPHSSAKKVYSTNNLEDPVLCDDAADCNLDLTTLNETKDNAGTNDPDLHTESLSDTSNKTNLSMLPQNKSRRFHNTLDVLHRSGLLNIAMKTKELARLNQATQTQLEKLQEQVSVYTKAIGSNSPNDWQKLQELLAESSGFC